MNAGRVQRDGFTLIELLVVISIIGVLIAIAVPALGKARRSAAMVREIAGIKQFSLAYSLYAQDNRGVVLPGYLREEWAGAAGFPVYGGEGGERLYGSVARRYTWRLAPYLGYARDGLVMDKRLLAEFNALPDRAATRDGFQWAFGTSPSFGINSTYVGGDARRGGFYGPSLARWGTYYVTRVDDARFTDKLLIFASSRGYHPLDGTTVVPGRHRIEGPWRASHVSDEIPTFTPWDAPAGAFDPSHTPSTYGHLDFRHFGKVIVTTFDGHAETLGIDDITDMRRWSNQADRPDWSP